MSFTVIYILGQPRTGSSFVGDWIARQQRILNAGEVWQSFRTLGDVTEPGFDAAQGRWAQSGGRAEKRAQIEADPFWAEVIAAPGDSPYVRLIHVAAQRGQALVDCSKSDHGLAAYEALGCYLVLVHSVRAFSTWAASMGKYRAQHGLAPLSGLRLLRAYLRLNRRYVGHGRRHPYQIAPQEQLGALDRVLDLSALPQGPQGGYHRAEMFGTPNFTPRFQDKRGTAQVTARDRLVFAMAGLRPRQELSQ